MMDPSIMPNAVLLRTFIGFKFRMLFHEMTNIQWFNATKKLHC